MARRLDILKKKNRRLVVVPGEFLKNIVRVQGSVTDYITALIAKLHMNGDAFLADEKNNALIDELRVKVKEYLMNGDYIKSVTEFSKEFDTQKNLNNDYYAIVSEKTFSTALGDSIVQGIKRRTVRSLISDSLNKGFLDPIESVLYTAVGAGAGYLETVTSIQNFIKGNDEIDGAILRYAKQLAGDAFANADRGYSKVIVDDLGIDWFNWSGDIIASSRCFCIERHGKYYHRNEIMAWGRGENVGDCGYPWDGMNRDTNENTIFNYAGGYGPCLHSIMGVSIFDVPKEDVLRNVENGNHEASDFEKEFFLI